MSRCTQWLPVARSLQALGKRTQYRACSSGFNSRFERPISQQTFSQRSLSSQTPTPPEVSHRSLGTAQELFMLHPSSPGAPFFLPNGMRILNRLKQFMYEEYHKQGYDEVSTPVVYNKELWQQSGHWDHYQEDMFFISDDGHTCDEGTELDKGLKPMNCPAHCLIFKHKTRSHRDLPLRLADFSPLHRNESSGALSGLTRVRQFHQDDGHIFCTPEQIYVEVKKCLEFVDQTYSLFGFEYTLNLATRPESSVGENSAWGHAEEKLTEALEANGKPWGVDEGGGAFYGPKIDITLTDAQGKTHQTATIQLDFQLPERFDLQYDADMGEFPRPVIIHRAVYGSLERFLAILCEHTMGKWPFWLSPTQVAVYAVTKDAHQYSREVHDALRAEGFHVTLDVNEKPLGGRLRKGRPAKPNYVVIIGAQEVEAGTIAVKCREADNSPGNVTVDEFIRLLKPQLKPPLPTN